MVLLGVGPRCAVRWAPPSGTGTTGPLGERLHGGNLLPCLRLGAFLQSARQSAGVPGKPRYETRERARRGPGREPDADPVRHVPTRLLEKLSGLFFVSAAAYGFPFPLPLHHLAAG